MRKPSFLHPSFPPPQVVPAGDGQCDLFEQCGEQCLPDHCWGWWTTYEYLDRPGAPWNATSCDSLPEKPGRM